MEFADLFPPRPIRIGVILVGERLEPFLGEFSLTQEFNRQFGFAILQLLDGFLELCRRPPGAFISQLFGLEIRDGLRDCLFAPLLRLVIADNGDPVGNALALELCRILRVDVVLLAEFVSVEFATLDPLPVELLFKEVVNGGFGIAVFELPDGGYITVNKASRQILLCQIRLLAFQMDDYVAHRLFERHLCLFSHKIYSPCNVQLKFGTIQAPTAKNFFKFSLVEAQTIFRLGIGVSPIAGAISFREISASSPARDRTFPSRSG